MATAPAQSVTSSDSRRILSCLLSKLESPDCRYHLKYSKLLHNTPQIEELLYRCVRIDVLTSIDAQNLGSLEKQRNTDLRYPSAAIYLHIIIDHYSTKRFYVGQANNLAERLKEHMNFRYRRTNQSLHYHALEQSRDDYFITLAYTPSAESNKPPGVSPQLLFRNLLEMWCCLMLRTLSKNHLIEFLPPDIEIDDRETEHLNVRLPLEQGNLFSWPELRDVLRDSPDPLRRGYYLYRITRYRQTDPKVLEYNHLIEERCRKLDAPSTPGRTPLQPTTPSPPPSTIDQAHQKSGLGDVKEVYPITPSSIRSQTVVNSATHSVGENAVADQSSIGCETKIANEEKRKWQSFEDTPSKPPRGKDAKRMCYEGSDSENLVDVDSIQQPSISKLDYNKDLDNLDIERYYKDFDYTGLSQE